MKFQLAEIDTRIKIKRNEQDGVQNFDLDNAYPQRVDYAIAASPRARQVVSVYAKHIRGAGYNDPVLYKSVVNQRGQTADQVIRLVSEDLAKFRGFAIHCDFNALGQIVAYTHVPFKEVRLGLPSEDTGQVTEVIHHPDWGKEIKRNFDKSKMKRYKLFSPENARAQFSSEPGTYPGQILYWTWDGIRYPLSSVDPVLEDVYSDNEAKQFRFNNIVTNFLASHVIQTDEMTETEARDFMSTLAKFQGARNGRKMLHLQKKQEEQTFKIEKLDIQENDKLFQYTEESVKENIRNAFMVPPVLCGDLIAGKMGTSKEMEDATIVYNGLTYDERLVLEEVTRKIISLMPSPRSLCPSEDYSIKAIQFTAHGPDASIVERSGEAVASKIVEVATNTQYSYAQRIAILTKVYGVSEDVAAAITTQTRGAA